MMVSIFDDNLLSSSPHRHFESSRHRSRKRRHPPAIPVVGSWSKLDGPPADACDGGAPSHPLMAAACPVDGSGFGPAAPPPSAGLADAWPCVGSCTLAEIGSTQLPKNTGSAGFGGRRDGNPGGCTPLTSGYQPLCPPPEPGRLLSSGDSPSGTSRQRHL